MITGEFKLIESIRERVDRAQGISGTITGIGDDCAVYRISHNRYGLFSTDISIENVHFDLSYTSLFDAGFRSMTANISDIYAMGGKPVLALVSIGIPPDFTTEMIQELYDGMLSCAVKHGVFISGGDTSRSRELIINISIYGETDAPVSRNGASAGERIYVTGNTGLSRLGLEILQNKSDRGGFSAAMEKHLRPEPRGGLIGSIIEDYQPTSMIDISDGLLIDLGHICDASRCGFELFEDKIPADRELKDFCSSRNLKTTDYSLYSGEEYELLFTTKLEIIDNREITYIGNIVPDGQSLISDGSRITVTIKGYDHFK